MIPLPPSCKVVYEIQISVTQVTDEIYEWFEMIGGHASEIKNFDWRGKEYITRQVQYGRAKPSHNRLDGSKHVLVRFAGEDASIASMFILKFMDQVVNHNLKEAEHYV
jgi:hypothetical protein